MKVFRGLPSKATLSPCALTIGNFDGVHRGHGALLEQLKKAANRLGIIPTVLTFSPHPRQFFASKLGRIVDAPITITPFRDKMQALISAGIERIYIARFNDAMAALTAVEFVQQILIERLNVHWIIVGENFHFGRNREGTTDLLQALGQRFGFEAQILPSVKESDIRISSSRIRQLLNHSQFDQVAHLLGRPYQLSGHVIRGNQLGRKLGFPTANLSMKKNGNVLSGVFITRVYGLSKDPLPAVSMVGNRPTIQANGQILLETHLLNYTGNCYGALIKVEFLKKLRDNQKFSDLNALKVAIRQDVDVANQYFKGLKEYNSQICRPN